MSDYNPMANAYKTDPYTTNAGKRLVTLLPYYYEGPDNDRDAHKILVALQEPERCACFEYEGDNSNCPVHGGMYPHPKPADTSELGTRCIVSGGEVMELGPQEGSEQIPF